MSWMYDWQWKLLEFWHNIKMNDDTVVFFNENYQFLYENFIKLNFFYKLVTANKFLITGLFIFLQIF
jgi:hypothetical protein